MRTSIFLILIFSSLQLLGQDSFTIAFGSCADTEKHDMDWQSIIDQNPDAWIWLGDIIYADTEDMQKMKGEYDSLKSQPGYQKLLDKTTVFGVYDDHDYGVNDGGKEYPKRLESRDLLFDFLDIPEAIAGDHEGAYQSHIMEKGSKKIKLILLDTRYFRDQPIKTENGYVPNHEGDILGDAQWKWLENELASNEADLHIIGSSIQLIASDHQYEKWSNFPEAKLKFYNLLTITKPNFPIVISGDRHIAEVSKIDVRGLKQPLYDFTSSGLTHTWSEKRPEQNSQRVGEMIYEKNFGIIEVNWTNDEPSVILKVKGYENATYMTLDITSER